MRSRLLDGLSRHGGQTALNILMKTMRFEFRGPRRPHQFGRAGRNVIFILWHGRLLPLTYLHRDLGIATLISLSGDGEFISKVVRGWGYNVVRGSSSRGGRAGLSRLIRAGRDGRSLAVTPDGPRGPRRKMKPGALLAAKRTGLPLLPLSAAADRAWWIESWDRFLVPKPLARVRVAYGDTVEVPSDASSEQLQALGAELETALNRLDREVDEGVGFG